MLNKVYYFIIAGLLSMTLFTGYLSYSFYGQKQVLDVRLEQTMLMLKEKDRQLSLLKDSTIITANMTAEAAKQTEEMNQTLGSLVQAIDDLERNKKEPRNEKPAVNVPSADDLQLQRLLDAAYCTANPADSACPASGTKN